MCKNISNENVIFGGNLKTNSDNFEFKNGVLTVRGYSRIEGNYHCTYHIKTELPITEEKVKECLIRGVKEIEHLRDCMTGEWLKSRSC
ncbi:MAG: hypothetical protein GY840_13370 [Pseudoalteromonas sp.]|nr:hypothetical protein [Pseudoalteromonas sp.]